MNIPQLLTIFIALLFTVTANAQTDSTVAESIKMNFTMKQPMPADLKLAAPEMNKTATISPVFHFDSQQLLIPAVGIGFTGWNLPTMMMPSNRVGMDMEDYKSQPVFKFKTGKTTFSFGVGVNMDAVRRGVDIQRMLRHQQMMMPRR